MRNPRCSRSKRFRDQLHQAVFDAVVHHLYKMPCGADSDVRNARFAIHLCGNRLEESGRSGRNIRSFPPGNDAWPKSSAFLAAGIPTPIKTYAFSGKFLLSPLCV
jgi:hypothetical protein